MAIGLTDGAVSYWASLAIWDRDDAVLLSLDVDPRGLKSATGELVTALSPEQALLEIERRAAFDSAVEARLLGSRRTHPILFCAWGQTVGIEVPSALREALLEVNRLQTARALTGEFKGEDPAVRKAVVTYKNNVGTVAKYPWEGALIELARVTYENAHGAMTGAQMIKHLKQWFEAKGAFPDERDIKKRVTEFRLALEL